MLNKIINFFRAGDVKPDPCKLCQVHRVVGCAHVDGPLCDMNTCDIKVNLEITPWKINEDRQD